MASNKHSIENLLWEYSYPFKTPWMRVTIHAVVAIVTPIFFIPKGEGLDFYLKLSSLILCLDFTQGIAHNYIFWRLNERYDWIKNTIKRVIYGLLIHSVVAYLIFLPWGIAVYIGIWKVSLVQSIPPLLNLWYIPIVFVLMIVAFGSASEFLKNWKKSLVNEEKLNAEMMAYKYESLRSQMNPHFLFNSFNVLINLVNQDQRLAIQFIQQLSQLYRNVLETRDRELISLHEEIKFIQSYIFLLKIRFEDKLSVSIQVPIADDEMIVPMVLQTVIENAVKHNAISKAYPLDIAVSRNNGRIVVTNPIRPKKIPDDSSGLGLQNIKQRYRFFTEKEIEIVSSDGNYTVSIPVLKQE
jgi:hypothetical protein